MTDSLSQHFAMLDEEKPQEDVFGELLSAMSYAAQHLRLGPPGSDEKIARYLKSQVLRVQRKVLAVEEVLRS